MKTTLKITQNELYTLFYSPIAWLILIIFTFQAGMTFSEAYAELLRQQALGYSPYGVTHDLLLGWNGVLSAMQKHLYLYIPLLTMGLMSQEYYRGSIKLLYSSPVTGVQIILGKYFSMIAYILILMSVFVVCFIFSLVTVKNLDVPYVLTGMAGLFLLTSAYAAIGLFMSALTSYQVVAAVGTLAILTIFNFIGGVGQEIPVVRDVTYWLSISGRADTFLSGLICSEDVLYFLLVIALFIGLSILKLQAVRTSKSLRKNILHYGLVILLVFLGGYLSSRPVLKWYFDATETQSNTLSEGSRKVMEQLDGPLTITTYVNFLDENYFSGLPAGYNEDFERFEKYIRFKPDIRMKYVYYYDKVYNPLLEKRYPDLSDLEKAERICEAIDWNLTDLVSPEEIRKVEDLSAEGHRFVRVLERANGQKSFLRLYSDNRRFPTENEITAALKRMVMKSPQVAFLTGHGERSIYTGGEGDYSSFAQNKTFRYSLLNQGFDICTLNLKNEPKVPENIDILVISDLRQPLMQEEQKAITDYIDKGGNLIIAGEVHRQENMNPVLAHLGLKFTEGILVQPTEDYTSDLIFGNVTSEAAALTDEFSYIHSGCEKMTMPGTLGIIQTEDKGFRIVPLVVTDSIGVWEELETTDFVEDAVQLNAEIGEAEKEWTTVVYLQRMRDQKDQRIVVTGDADCIGNAELGKRRTGFRSANFTLITESFRLLTNGEFPVNTSRPGATDNELWIQDDAIIWIKLFFMGFFPGILLFFSIRLWWKRRRK